MRTLSIIGLIWYTLMITLIFFYINTDINVACGAGILSLIYAIPYSIIMLVKVKKVKKIKKIKKEKENNGEFSQTNNKEETNPYQVKYVIDNTINVEKK